MDCVVGHVVGVSEWTDVVRHVVGVSEWTAL